MEMITHSLFEKDINNVVIKCKYIIIKTGRRGRDRMVVGFKTTYAISAYHY